ncbi:MAG: hypothetical protein OXF56_27150, partial [Rhodobacteraceae bacterium]|nr:hypothetical protein [Paracoccaceae bacterium]
MREMVFNHASATLQEVKQTEVVEWIRGVVGGMAQLVGEGVVGSTLRLGRELHDIQCLPDLSLWSAIDLLQKYGHKDDYLFFLRLSAKSPLLNEVSEELVSRFKGCEDLTLPA